jgi:hypothetical protein
MINAFETESPQGTLIAPKRGREEAPGRAAPVAPRDRVCEGHLKAIGFWEGLSAVLLVGVGGLATVGTSLVEGVSGAGLVSGLATFAAAALALAACVGLWTRRAYGRYAAALGAAFGLVSTLPAFAMGSVGILVGLIGLGWHGAILRTVMGPSAQRICSPDYEEAVRAYPGKSPWLSSPFFYWPFLLAAVLVGGTYAITAFVMGS